MLEIELDLPFVWQPAQPDTAEAETLWQEAQLLLRVIQGLDSPPPREADRETAFSRGLERLEAKLDLVLHLMARDPRAAPPGLATRRLTLYTQGLRCMGEPTWRTGDTGLCVLRPSPALPLPIRIPARLDATDAQGCSIRWPDMPDTVAEPWSQWLFRQHRRAVHARKEGA
ncbi:MAG TPA: PilZ domain-containing protein [Thiobacillaceae bacterium]|nr:PilZ domain-containing protein [Thiobacillaceae bacterium]